MKQLIHFAIIILIFFLSSCVEKEIDYEYNFGEPGIVVSGILNQEGVEVFLQYTVNPMNPSDDLVANAKVFVYDRSHQIVELSEDDPGHFISPNVFTPIYDKLYHLQIVTTNGDTLVSNEQELVRPVKIDTCYYKPRTYNKGKDLLFMEFTDPSDEKNFYVYYRYDEYGNGELLPSQGNWDLFGTPVNDELFNGQNKTFVYDFYLSYRYEGQSYVKDSIRLKLFSYSEDFAAYLIAIDDSDFTYDVFLFDQPIFPKSFIQGGYGIFGSYAVDTYVLHLNSDDRP